MISCHRTFGDVAYFAVDDRKRGLPLPCPKRKANAMRSVETSWHSSGSRFRDLQKGLFEAPVENTVLALNTGEACGL